MLCPLSKPVEVSRTVGHDSAFRTAPSLAPIGDFAVLRRAHPATKELRTVHAAASRSIQTRFPCLKVSYLRRVAGRCQITKLAKDWRTLSCLAGLAYLASQSLVGDGGQRTSAGLTTAVMATIDFEALLGSFLQPTGLLPITCARPLWSQIETTIFDCCRSATRATLQRTPSEPYLESRCPK